MCVSSSCTGWKALLGESTVISIPGIPGGPRKDATWCRLLCILPLCFFPYCIFPFCISSPCKAQYQSRQARKGELVQSCVPGLYSDRDMALGVKMSFLGALGWSC